MERARSLFVPLAGSGFEISLLSTHRKIYCHRITSVVEPGHVEMAHPSFDWGAIWKTVPRLPFSLRDFYFLFNHSLLYTRDWSNRMDATLNPRCHRYNGEVESADNLMTGCPARATTINWLNPVPRLLRHLDTGSEGISRNFRATSPARLLVYHVKHIGRK